MLFVNDLINLIGFKDLIRPKQFRSPKENCTKNTNTKKHETQPIKLHCYQHFCW